MIMNILILGRSLRKSLFLHQSHLHRIGQNHLKSCATLQIFAIDAIFGQRIDNKQHVIYYLSRTLNDAQINYTTTEKEFLVVVFAMEKFRPYLLGSKTIIFTDHYALRYLMLKKDAKA